MPADTETGKGGDEQISCHSTGGRFSAQKKHYDELTHFIYLKKGERDHEEIF